jgi:hypothetical protein
MMRHHLLPILLVLAATGARAQDLEVSASVYGWLPGITGSLETGLGTIDIAPEGDGEALLGLEAGFLGSLNATQGRWSLAGDLLFARLGADAEAPLGLLYTGAGVTQDLMAVSAYGFFRAVDRPGAVLDLGPGLRSFDLSLAVSLDGGGLPDARETISARWTNALLAARTTIDLSDRWFLHAIADWGGTGAGDTTWQAYAGLGYRVTDDWSAELGYRHMQITRDIRNASVDLALDGALLGVTYRF